MTNVAWKVLLIRGPGIRVPTSAPGKSLVVTLKNRGGGAFFFAFWRGQFSGFGQLLVNYLTILYFKATLPAVLPSLEAGQNLPTFCPRSAEYFGQKKKAPPGRISQQGGGENRIIQSFWSPKKGKMRPRNPGGIGTPSKKPGPRWTRLKAASLYWSIKIPQICVTGKIGQILIG